MNTINITPYERSHRQAVLDLVFHSSQVHAHFDWCDTDQWLRTEGAVIRLAWQHMKLVGVLGASPPLSDCSWVRLAAVANGFHAGEMLHSLWDAMTEELTQIGAHEAAILLVEQWMQPHLSTLGFAFQEEIITLSRGRSRPLRPQPSPANIQIAANSDIAVMAQIDLAAFTPPWQMSQHEIYQACRIASASTVAVIDKTIVGFQISTLYQDSAHLARLAVLPELQGQGIGRALVHDLINRFHRRRIYSITVNTQESNVRSQRLYERFDFYRNGYDLSVWIASIKGNPS